MKFLHKICTVAKTGEIKIMNETLKLFIFKWIESGAGGDRTRDLLNAIPVFDLTPLINQWLRRRPLCRFTVYTAFICDKSAQNLHTVY